MKNFKGFKDILQRYEKKMIHRMLQSVVLILYVAMLYSLKSLHFKLKQMDVRLFFSLIAWYLRILLKIEDFFPRFTLFMTVVYRVTYARTYRFPSTFIICFL